jgi:hypothetical protein
MHAGTGWSCSSHLHIPLAIEDNDTLLSHEARPVLLHLRRPRHRLVSGPAFG